MRPLGLVIVHGIGEPTAGEALTDFTDSLETAGLASFEPAIRVRRFTDPAASSHDQLRFFPAHLRQGTTADGVPIQAAEVYWGSASQLAPGRLGVVQGIFSLMLNVPALVVGAGDRNGGLSGALQTTSLTASMLLAGPAFALNALLLAAIAAHTLLVLMVGDSRAVDVAVPLAAAALTLWLGFLRWPWFPETWWSFWLAGPVALAAALTLDTGAAGFSESFARAAVLLLEWVVGLVVVLLLAASVVFALGRAAGLLGPPATTAVLAASLQFGFWTVLIPLTWQMVFAWMPDTARAPWMASLFDRAAPVDGLQWLMSAIVLGTFGVVLVWRHAHERAEARGGGTAPAPRLIVHPLAAAAIVGVTTVGTVALLLVAAAGSVAAAPPWVAALLALTPSIRGTETLVALVPLFLTEIRLALDLAHDVISYIHYRCELGRRLLARTRTAPPPAVNPMRARFHVVVDHLMKEAAVERLIVVAHSQGSVIALDELAHAWQPGELPPATTFVTFGSPITHLYQRYFPNVYPDWNDATWDRFFERVTRWINLYRLGDYVGATIARPSRCRFVEMALGAGGHRDYWRDPRLLAALGAAELFAARDMAE